MWEMKEGSGFGAWRCGVEPRWTHGSKLAIGTAYYRLYWRGIQLDEVAFPVLLAWRLWKHEALGEFHPYEMVRRASGFLIREGPGIPAVRQGAGHSRGHSRPSPTD